MLNARVPGGFGMAWPQVVTTELSQDEWFRNVHKFCFLDYIKQSEETLMYIFLMIVLEFKYIWIFFYTLNSCC
jgi:hypothetical protein